MTIELTPELRKAITTVYNDGQQNRDQGDFDPDASVDAAYELVYTLTNYALEKQD